MGTPSQTTVNRPIPAGPSRPATARTPESLAPSAQKAYDDDMTPPPFDTLRAAARIREEGGFDEAQANAIVVTFADCMSQTLASKADVQQSERAVRSDLEKLETALRSDMEKSETALRSDLERMETALRSDMEKSEAVIRSDMEKSEAAIRSDMQKMETGIRSDMRSNFDKLNGKMDLIAEQLGNQIAATARKTLLQLGTLVLTLASIMAALQRLGIL